MSHTAILSLGMAEQPLCRRQLYFSGAFPGRLTPFDGYSDINAPFGFQYDNWLDCMVISLVPRHFRGPTMQRPASTGYMQETLIDGVQLDGCLAWPLCT